MENEVGRDDFNFEENVVKDIILNSAYYLWEVQN